MDTNVTELSPDLFQPGQLLDFQSSDRIIEGQNHNFRNAWSALYDSVSLYSVIPVFWQRVRPGVGITMTSLLPIRVYSCPFVVAVLCQTFDDEDDESV